MALARKKKPVMAIRITSKHFVTIQSWVEINHSPGTGEGLRNCN